MLGSHLMKINGKVHVSIFSYLSESFLWLGWQAFASLTLASSGLLVGPLRSCDCLDDDHMTAVGHRRWEELVPWSRFMAGCPIFIFMASLTFLLNQMSSLVFCYFVMALKGNSKYFCFNMTD